MATYNPGWSPLIEQSLRRRFASANQGNLAESALQPGDLSNLATASQGALADSAIQPSVLAFGQRLLLKANPMAVAFIKTDLGAAQVGQAIRVLVGNAVVSVAAGTAIAMPTLAAGNDYTIWVTPLGAVQASASWDTPPVSGAVKIGGFHFAPGGNATGQSGGNLTPQINQFSFWDLCWRPRLPADPRGMALVANSFWAGIYFLGVNHLTDGPSRHGVTIANGNTPQKIPLEYGGNGSNNYSNFSWWNAAEALSIHGLRLPHYHEFQVLAYGVTENVSRATNPISTGLNVANAGQDERFTSRWGIVQATGCVTVWGLGHGSNGASADWANNTQSRGETYSLPNAPLFGGFWATSGLSGSRYSAWNDLPSLSNSPRAARGVVDHLISVF